MTNILEKFLVAALAEYGIAEVKGAAHNERILEYHSSTTLKATTDEVAWCSSFVNFIVEKCGVVPTKSAAARSWLNWGKGIDKPVTGCVVVFDRRSADNPNAAHVGFYCTDRVGIVQVLGGNQGNMVCVAPYDKRKVLGYRVPTNYVP